jgi:hypothetical protein
VVNVSELKFVFEQKEMCGSEHYYNSKPTCDFFKKKVLNFEGRILA